jgi:hypothetical protein
MLKEFSSGNLKDTNNKGDQIKILFSELEKLKKDKKEVIGALKTRDLEIQKLNRKIMDL